MGRKCRLFVPLTSSLDSQIFNCRAQNGESLRPHPQIFPFCRDCRRRPGSITTAARGRVVLAGVSNRWLGESGADQPDCRTGSRRESMALSRRNQRGERVQVGINCGAVLFVQPCLSGKIGKKFLGNDNVCMRKDRAERLHIAQIVLHDPAV
jgi:hypothetical protein